MSSYLRPDEKAAQHDIEKSKRHDERIRSGIKTAASVVSGAASIGIGAKILPFINKYIPTDMAIKGISKVSPEMGNLLKKGMSQGLNVEDGLEFIKGQIEKKQEPAKQSKNIIEQSSPELHQFIDQEVRKGRKPIEAGALALSKEQFSKVIKNIEKSHKTPWASILESVYGGEGMAPIQGQSQSALQPEQMQQQQGQQQGQQKQPGQGQGQQALMSILQKLQQSRGIQ